MPPSPDKQSTAPAPGVQATPDATGGREVRVISAPPAANPSVRNPLSLPRAVANTPAPFLEITASIPDTASLIARGSRATTVLEMTTARINNGGLAPKDGELAARLRDAAHRELRLIQPLIDQRLMPASQQTAATTSAMRIEAGAATPLLPTPMPAPAADSLPLHRQSPVTITAQTIADLPIVQRAENAFRTYMSARNTGVHSAIATTRKNAQILLQQAYDHLWQKAYSEIDSAVRQATLALQRIDDPNLKLTSTEVDQLNQTIKDANARSATLRAQVPEPLKAQIDTIGEQLRTTNFNSAYLTTRERQQAIESKIEGWRNAAQAPGIDDAKREAHNARVQMWEQVKQDLLKNPKGLEPESQTQSAHLNRRPLTALVGKENEIRSRLGLPPLPTHSVKIPGSLSPSTQSPVGSDATTVTSNPTAEVKPPAPATTASTFTNALNKFDQKMLPIVHSPYTTPMVTGAVALYQSKDAIARDDIGGTTEVSIKTSGALAGFTAGARLGMMSPGVLHTKLVAAAGLGVVGAIAGDKAVDGVAKMAGDGARTALSTARSAATKAASNVSDAAETVSSKLSQWFSAPPPAPLPEHWRKGTPLGDAMGEQKWDKQTETQVRDYINSLAPNGDLVRLREKLASPEESQKPGHLVTLANRILGRSEDKSLATKNALVQAAPAAEPTAAAMPTTPNPALIIQHQISRDDSLSHIADSPAMREARAAVRQALGGKTQPTQTVLSLVSALMFNTIKPPTDNPDIVKSGQTASVNLADIPAIVQQLRDKGKINARNEITGVKDLRDLAQSIAPSATPAATKPAAAAEKK